ncbi:MAG: hypothetical protein HY435_00565 [Candidatus Liptonbacteria bacterium]|nr:hypothetical protein [Candidatus Liptonbacteria bacterium]
MEKFQNRRAGLMNPYETLGKVLGVPGSMLEALARAMARRTGVSGVFERIAGENKENIGRTLEKLNVRGARAGDVQKGLRAAIEKHESQLLAYVSKLPGATEFERAAMLAKNVARVGDGFFLKREFARDILRKRPPENLLAHLGYRDVEELFKRSGIMEAMSALRFMESDEWMHETFEKAYSNFTASDFEERPIEVKVLGPEWNDVAAKFVAKKHHNVSHLKEFGVIFLNPIKEDIPGKFLRDFALLLHYFHEIEFYSKMFLRYSKEKDFTSRFKAFLRGDVREAHAQGEGEWLIVQRYLFKENPEDPRLLLPRVNPESLHWGRGERDLVEFAEQEASIELEMWRDLDWAAGFFGDGELVSFDLEDNAMSAVSHHERKPHAFNYHQREALWTKIFSEYAGGEAETEKLLIHNFGEGVVRF